MSEIIFGFGLIWKKNLEPSYSNDSKVYINF